MNTVLLLLVVGTVVLGLSTDIAVGAGMAMSITVQHAKAITSVARLTVRFFRSAKT
jgi:hypothetical protein